jgi:hypothetical protein
MVGVRMNIDTSSPLLKRLSKTPVMLTVPRTPFFSLMTSQVEYRSDIHVCVTIGKSPYFIFYFESKADDKNYIA